MESPSSLTDFTAPIVIDASVAINLTASGFAESIIKALPNSILVADIVCEELESGRFNGRRNAEIFDSLVAKGLVKVVILDEATEPVFERLVVGAALWTLDDGEAATIAHGAMRHAIAAIDERKANRVSLEFFPKLQLCCSVDLLSHPLVIKSLGQKGTEEAVLAALQMARMRVLPKHLAWVLEVIGPEQASECPSLPRAARL
jgi:hypothetical protein